jgi:hypothetical protein
MAASSLLMITEAERRFPVQVRVAIPPAEFGEQVWLDDNTAAPMAGRSPQAGGSPAAATLS